VQQARFEEVRQGLEMATRDMEEVGTYLKKFADIVTPEIMVDELYQRIHEVVGVLDKVVQCSWSLYTERSLSPSDCWENTWEEVYWERQWEKQRSNPSGHVDHEGDCYDWGNDDTSLEDSLIDSEGLNDRRCK
jgi:hypothetical protein